MKQSRANIQACVAFKPLTAVLACGLLMLAGCRDDAAESGSKSGAEDVQAVSEQIWPPDNRREHQFVGSQKCAQCHSELFERYQNHPMANSMALPTGIRQSALQSLPVEVSVGNRTYHVEVKDGQMFQAESMTDADGEVFRQECKIDIAFGSGIHGHTFGLIQQNSMFQAPITWYEDVQRWDLSPGYDAGNHQRFERRISDGCMSCHIGQVNYSGHNTNRLQKKHFGEASIGCERCHGPGSEHVEFHLSEKRKVSAEDPIVNPSKLDIDRRDSVCYQCHLSGKARILRSGRSHYDFRPGDKLSDIWVALVNVPAAGKEKGATNLKAVSHVEQTVSSKCYQKSEGRFHCVTCHDPHGFPDEAIRIQNYNSTCASCHTADTTVCGAELTARQQTIPQDSCVNCHMPKKTTSNIVHTARTDHRLLKSYEGEPPAGEMATGVFQLAKQELPPLEIERAYGLMLEAIAKSPAQLSDANHFLGPFRNGSLDDLEWLIAKSSVEMQLGDIKAASQLLEQAAALQSIRESSADGAQHRESTSESTSENLLFAELRLQMAQGEFLNALQTVNELLQLSPWNSANENIKGQILIRLNRAGEAAEAFERALEINPSLQSARELLRQTMKERGDAEAAAKQADLLRRIKQLETSPWQELRP